MDSEIQNVHLSKKIGMMNLKKPNFMHELYSIIDENNRLKKENKILNEEKGDLILKLNHAKNEHQDKIRELKDEYHQFRKDATFKYLIQNCFDTREDNNLALLQLSIQKISKYLDKELPGKTPILIFTSMSFSSFI